MQAPCLKKKKKEKKQIRFARNGKTAAGNNHFC